MWVDYEPQPKNSFQIRVNDADIYSLVKEEVDYDPTKTEQLGTCLNINDQKDTNDPTPLGLKWTIMGAVPWIIDDVEDKIQNALGMGHLTCLFIFFLCCKSWVANEFLDVLAC